MAPHDRLTGKGATQDGDFPSLGRQGHYTLFKEKPTQKHNTQKLNQVRRFPLPRTLTAAESSLPSDADGKTVFSSPLQLSLDAETLLDVLVGSLPGTLTAAEKHSSLAVDGGREHGLLLLVGAHLGDRGP